MNPTMLSRVQGCLMGGAFSEEWKNFRPEYEEVVRLGTELFTAAFKSK